MQLYKMNCLFNINDNIIVVGGGGVGVVVGVIIFSVGVIIIVILFVGIVVWLRLQKWSERIAIFVF
jgi:hypothetical protein